MCNVVQRSECNSVSAHSKCCEDGAARGARWALPAHQLLQLLHSFAQQATHQQVQTLWVHVQRLHSSTYALERLPVLLLAQQLHTHCLPELIVATFYNQLKC